MRRLVYSSAAQRSLEYLTIEMGAEKLASPVVGRIRKKCLKLAALPMILGRHRDDLAPGLRSFPFRGYVIFLRYDEARDCRHREFTPRSGRRNGPERELIS